MSEEYRRTFRLPDGGRGGDLEEEMAFHIEAMVEALLVEGWRVEDARAEALRRFGDPAAVRAACRRERRWGMGVLGRLWGMVWQDAWYAVRQLVRRPLSSGLALLTLVVGVGATAVVFSVVHATVLKPLPFQDPERLVLVEQTSPQGRAYSMSEPNFVDFRGRQRTFTEMAGLGFIKPVLTGEGEAVRRRACG